MGVNFSPFKIIQAVKQDLHLKLFEKYDVGINKFSSLNKQMML